MHFTTVLAASAAITGALAGQYYEEPVYTTVDDSVYTSVKTCSDSAAPTYEPTMAPVYEAEPTDYPTGCSDVTYTSYATYHQDYDVYTSTMTSVSKCPMAEPTYEPVPHNTTTPYYAPPPVYETPAPEPYPVADETMTHTYYTTVCPAATYCYGTTITSTYCPGPETTYVPHPPKSYEPEPEPTYEPVPPPTYTQPVYNDTTPVYSPPPSYTGAASSNAVSFGVAAVAGLVALFIAA